MAGDLDNLIVTSIRPIPGYSSPRGADDGLRIDNGDLDAVCT